MCGLVDIGDLREVKRIGAEELSVEWRIRDVLSLPAGSDVWYLSPDFRTGIDRFRLRLNPGWNPLCSASSGCLRLGLVKYQGGPRQTFHVTVDVKGGVEKRREGEKEFWEHDEYFWNDFCSRYELEEHGTRMMTDGVLTITCVLRRSGASGGVYRRPSVEADTTNGSHFQDKQGKDEGGHRKGFGGPYVGGIDDGNRAGLRGTHAGGIASDVGGCLGGLLLGGMNWVYGAGLGGLSAGAAFEYERRMNRNESNKIEDNEGSKTETCRKNIKKTKKTKKISLPAQHGCVIKSLKAILASGCRADFTLKSSSREWPVHRAILDCRSGFFDTFVELDEVRLDSDLPEVGGALDAVLQFLYTGEVGHLTTNNVFGIYVAAHQFLLDDLNSMCVQYMRDRMCPEMVCSALVLAETYEEAELKERALECYFRESVNVIKTPEWTQLRESHPDIIAEIFEQLFRRKGNKKREQ